MNEENYELDELETEIDTIEEDDDEIEVVLDTESESDSKKEEVEVKSERPWKKEDKESNSIPASRFSEVNNQRKEAEAKAERLERELAQYREKQEQLSKVKSPNDIKPENYKTVEEYLSARDEAVIAAASADAEKRYVEREQKRIQEEQNNARVKRFEDNYNQAIKSNPEVEDAVAYLNGFADRLHPQVALELLEEDLGPEIIFAMVTDKDKMNMLINDPQKAIREIHRLGAKLIREAKEETRSVTKQAPIKPMQVQAKAAIPAKVKSKTVVRKSIDDMSQTEYEAYVNKHGMQGL